MTQFQDAKSVNELEKHLLAVMSSQRFIDKQGLGNEVPFFICPYPPQQSVEIERMQPMLFNALEQKGVRVLAINLYDLCLELLAKRGLLDRVLGSETQFGKDQLRDLLQGVLDPQNHLVPAIGEKIRDSQFDILVMSGIGEVFPYVRSHNVLNNLQSAAKDQPTVMFFPGTYAHSLATGASLDLFGRLHDDKYYRAFNILHYEV